MNTTLAGPAAPHHRHPAPHRGRVGRFGSWFAIVGPPLAWGTQLVVGASLAGHSCYPHDVPLAHPLWPGVVSVALAVEAVALALCLLAGWAAWRNWRRSRAERPGSGHHLVESGDGRTRFIAMVGMMTSGLFAVATAFAALNLVAVPPCGG